MLDLLELIFEFRTLLARRDVLRQPLSEADRERLETLERDLAWKAPATREGKPAQYSMLRRFGRVDVKIAATIEVGSQEADTEIVNAGGGGFVVSPAPSLGVGDLTVVTVSHPEDGASYRFPARVVWRTEGMDSSTLGLALIGVPDKR